MDGVQMYDTRLRAQPSNEGDIQGQSQQHQAQIPGGNVLEAVVQNRPSLTPLEEITPSLMSALYGICLGNGIAALRDHSDGLTIGAGMILTSIAGLYACKLLRSTSRTEGSYNIRETTKYVAIFLLCAASGAITNTHNYC